MKGALSNDWEVMPEANIADKDEENTVQQHTSHPKKVKDQDVRHKMIMKELISTTYLITDESSMTNLTHGLDSLYAKAKAMMSSEDDTSMKGIPCTGIKKGTEEV